jgi:hypothetical protein
VFVNDWETTDHWFETQAGSGRFIMVENSDYIAESSFASMAMHDEGISTAVRQIYSPSEREGSASVGFYRGDQNAPGEGGKALAALGFPDCQFGLQDSSGDGKFSDGKNNILPKELLEAADATAKIADEFGPFKTKTHDAVEKLVRDAVAKAPPGREQEYIEALAKRLTESSKKFKVSLEQSPVSKDVVRVTLAYRDQDLEGRFSVFKTPAKK